MAISQPPFQSTLVDADDRVQTPWAQWFSQLQPILQSIVASGPTSGRPTQNLFIGYPYFDTTIDQMVYWNGVIWVTYAPSTTGTSILKGNGTGGFNNAIAGTDFAPATSGTAILYGNGAGGFSSVAIGSGVTFAGGILSALGSGGTVTSVSGTGSVNGITLTGTVTSSGSLTLGGTLGGIGNSQLTNSSITINGSIVSLGGSTTVTATATNALTIGTGLSGTSYNGSTAVTIANTGVLSITGTALQITASASTGAVTLSLPQSINSGAAPTFLSTNFTGTASININGTVGATTATTGAFTSISASADITLGSEYTTSALKVGTNGSYIGRQSSDGSLNINTAQANINFNIIGANLAYINSTGVTSTQGYYVGVHGSSILRNSADGSTTFTQGQSSYIKYVLSGAEKIRFTATGGLNLGTYTNDPGLGSIIMSGLTAASAAAPTIASATTIAPTKAITFISGVTPIVTITAPSPISLGGGTITLIPTGIFTTTTAGNIALASTAVVRRALTMTYDVTTAKWYPSY